MTILSALIVAVHHDFRYQFQNYGSDKYYIQFSYLFYGSFYLLAIFEAPKIDSKNYKHFLA